MIGTAIEFFDFYIYAVAAVLVLIMKRKFKKSNKETNERYE